MNCDRLREVLIEHVEGVLGAADAEGAREHLAHCLSCSDLREEVRRGFAAMDAWEDDEELPAGSFDRLLARLPREGTPFPADAGAGLPGHEPVLVGAGADPALATASGAPAPRRAGRVLPFAAGLATAAAALWVLQGVFPQDDPGVKPASSGYDVVKPDTTPDPYRLDPATAFEEREALRDAEQPLRFDGSNVTVHDWRNGLVRNVRLPDGVDPASVVIVDEDPVLEPAGAVR